MFFKLKTYFARKIVRYFEFHCSKTSIFIYFYLLIIPTYLIAPDHYQYQRRFVSFLWYRPRMFRTRKLAISRIPCGAITGARVIRPQTDSVSMTETRRNRSINPRGKHTPRSGRKRIIVYHCRLDKLF